MDTIGLKQKYGNLTRDNKDLINLNPLQTAGRLTEAAKKVLVEFGDGYSVCDHCKGRLDEIRNPPIYDFVYGDLPKFLGADVTRITSGAREGIFMVLHSLTKPGDVVLMDGNRHYSTYVAAERAGLKIIEVPSSAEPDKLINVEDYGPLIEREKPKLILLTYPDGEFGNLADAKRLGELAKKYNVPYLINGAYAVGRMPISMKELGADFIVGSGHKSMASAGPIGVLGMKKEWEPKVLALSTRHKNKELECLGCTARGSSLMTLMASFPYVVERVKHWDEEVKKAQWFSGEMEKLGGIKQVGQRPHTHDLIKFDTPIFYQISEVHPGKRGFLYDALKNKGIVGLKHGNTKQMKISTYGTPREDLEKVLEVFRTLIDSYKDKIKK